LYSIDNLASVKVYMRFIMMNTRHFLIVNLFLVVQITIFSLFLDYNIADAMEHINIAIASFFLNLTVFADSIFNNLLWVIALSSVIALILFFFQKHRMYSISILVSLLTLFSCTFATNILKHAVKRQRPGVYLEMQRNESQSEGRDYSFPSAHTALYMGFFFPFTYVFGKKYHFGILLFPSLIALGRIILNEHFVSDVLFSFLLVFNVSYILMAFFKKISGNKKYICA